VLRLAGVAAAYYGSAKAGLGLAFATESVTAVWPPTGIALAAVVLWGKGMWPGVALGAFAANVDTDVPLYTVLGITVGNTLEALVGGHLLRRADFRPSLERVRDVGALVVLAALLSTLVSATIGVGSLLAGNEIETGDLGSVWRTWWLGDVGGDLLVAPALFVLATHWPYRRAPGRPLEAVALALGVVALSLVVFSNTTPLAYLLFPFLIWGALRFWQPGAIGASALVAAVAITLTRRGDGPFAAYSQDDRLQLAQSFVGVACVTGLVLAAVITERRRTEDTVEYIAGTLQESLVPSRLPQIPGIETAIDFRPAGERHLVGGDFYDVFEADDGSWAVTVGDVVGKGAEAAAVTGLARYTLRAAAVHEQSPSGILRLLNHAILRQRPVGEFCTVAFARIEPGPTGAVRVTAASGGHPLPLVRRADGAVETIGEHGSLLGVIEQPDVHDHSVELAAGDALVLYTDGLTDARAPEHTVSRAELETILSSSPAPSAAAIAEGISDAVLAGAESEPRDDIALLVLRVTERAAPGVEHEVAIRLAEEPTAIASAREAVDELDGELDEGRLTTVRLLVSELVTNSVRHAHGAAPAWVELRTILLPDRVRVEVTDRGPGFDPGAPAPAPDRESGWGLYLLDRLADRWGIERKGVTTVWFELDRYAR
jgi:serine phosphatase RsbU (regulator of sigma subunit)/integral membrane sensor domain MASE1/anti-sigma regulatory factor (Ser/Thr protein kinase)